jgi:hypothetical protein
MGSSKAGFVQKICAIERFEHLTYHYLAERRFFVRRLVVHIDKWNPIILNRKDRAKRYHKSSIFNSGLSGLGICIIESIVGSAPCDLLGLGRSIEVFDSLADLACRSMIRIQPQDLGHMIPGPVELALGCHNSAQS